MNDGACAPSPRILPLPSGGVGKSAPLGPVFSQGVPKATDKTVMAHLIPTRRPSLSKTENKDQGGCGEIGGHSQGSEDIEWCGHHGKQHGRS